MSYDLAWQVINLQPTERPAHVEYTLHWQLMARVTGLSRDDPNFEKEFRRLWQIDLCWHTHDGPVPWDQRGRITDMGHAEFLADGSDQRQSARSPFRDVDDVLAFDAVAEYGLTDFDELVDFYQRLYRDGQRDRDDAVFTGGYYHTLVSGAILAFGWDLLLEAAAYPEQFERVLDSFFELSLHHYRAWARTDIKAFICHDDMVWSSGPFMRPAFYREVIFPRYAKLWAVLKEAGKKVLFCCDGQWTDFLADAAAAGADGFIFEPMTSFDVAVERFGRTHVLVGSKVDCRTLTFGTPEQVRSEVDASVALGRECPGWICAVGNHIAPNVPVDNALAYYDRLSSTWNR
ncbi:MAG: hypothetical protein JXL80_16805 [Planctomycetes bacterium]|nr:hypothetical protein [Planctomycetota bacterium]